jgi:hypothetical protein
MHAPNIDSMKTEELEALEMAIIAELQTRQAEALYWEL